MNARPAEDHLSDEELSDLVDGIGSPDAVQHAGRCPSCAARLDGWRSVASRLAALHSSAVPVGAREAAVTAAMESSGRVGRAGRYLRPLSAVAAAAAVVVAVGFGVAQAGHSGGAKSASRGVASSVASPAPAAAGASTAPRADDLGPLSSPAAVASAVDRVLARSDFRPMAGSPTAASGYAAGAGSAAASQGTTSSGAPTGAASPGAASSGAAGVGSGVSSGSAGASSSLAGPGAPTPGVAPRTACQDPSGRFAGSSVQVLFTAAAVYQGTPSTVYVYQVGAGRRAVVVDARTCAVLAEVGV